MQLNPATTSTSPGSLLSATGRWLPFAPNAPSCLNPKIKAYCAQFLRTLFGYPPPRHDPARTTAWLDGLRGVAAFLVMAYHYHLDMFYFKTEAPYGAPGTGRWDIWRLPYLRLWWCSGHTQVGIFFVLSGFVLSWGGLASIREGRHEKFAQSLGSATFRRWLRLFMPCWVVGTLSLLQFWLGLVSLPFDRKTSFLAQAWDYILECERFANPFHLERNNFELLNKYNHTMWTIPLEWAGSLLVFATLLGVNQIRNYRRRTVVVITISLYACQSARWNYWLFASGILLADYVRQAGGFEQLSNRMTIWSRLGWMFVLLLGGWLAGVPDQSIYYERPGYKFLEKLVPHKWTGIEGGNRFWWSWAGIFIITSISHFATLRRLFERQFPRYLGRISFMLYLTHRMIGEIVGSAIRRQLPYILGMPIKPPGQEQQIWVIQGAFWSFLAYLFTWCMLAPLAFILANFLEILVDVPCTRFSKWVDDKFTNGFVQVSEPPEELELLMLPR
jgi:peptidoglycan/LPS O-acetylase OafA/YrhL